MPKNYPSVKLVHDTVMSQINAIGPGEYVITASMRLDRHLDNDFFEDETKPTTHETLRMYLRRVPGVRMIRRDTQEKGFLIRVEKLDTFKPSEPLPHHIVKEPT